MHLYGGAAAMLDDVMRVLFFSCIAERVRDIVGQQLEIRKRE